MKSWFGRHFIPDFPIHNIVNLNWSQRTKATPNWFWTLWSVLCLKDIKKNRFLDSISQKKKKILIFFFAFWLCYSVCSSSSIFLSFVFFFLKISFLLRWIVAHFVSEFFFKSLYHSRLCEIFRLWTHIKCFRFSLLFYFDACVVLHITIRFPFHFYLSISFIFKNLNLLPFHFFFISYSILIGVSVSLIQINFFLKRTFDTVKNRRLLQQQQHQTLMNFDIIRFSIRFHWNRN